MHPEAEAWVEFVSKNIRPPRKVMDQGGRNVNGSVRKYFPNTLHWISVDITDGEGVDVVADSSYYVTNNCDLVLSTELFEHTPRVYEIIRCAYRSLSNGGHYVVTTAGLGRPAHNAHGRAELDPNEYYMNINPQWLLQQFERVGFKNIMLDIRSNPSDVRVWATK